MKQTAVEWYVEEAMKLEILKLKGKISLKKMLDLLSEKVNQAKEMEKEQIKDAWNTKVKIDDVLVFTDNRTAEEYYNETYKSE